MADRKTFFILDGNSLLHRAWHALPPLSTKDGRVVHAAYGFAMVLDKMLRDWHPDYLAVAWDLPGKTFRHEAVESYKATRVKQPQELYDQIPICKEILAAYGIPSLEAPGYEADDVIGTISVRDERGNFDTTIVTGDLDALQLVDHNTNVLFFVKGLSETKRYDPAAVRERYGLDPEQLIDYKAMRGDASDNVKGIPGVGEKTATEILKKYRTLEVMFRELKKLPEEKLAKKVLPYEENAREAKMLVTIIRDVKLPFHIDEAKIHPPDLEKLVGLYRSLEFRRLVQKLSPDASVSSSLTSKKTAVASVALPKGEVGVLAEIQSPDLFGATLASVAVLDENGVRVMAHPNRETVERVKTEMGEAKKILTHDYKSLLHALDADPSALSHAAVEDTMIASYLLHSGSRTHDFPAVIHDVLGISKVTSLEDSVRLLPSLVKKLDEYLREEDVEKLFREVEAPLIPILYRLERVGIKLDTEFLKEVSGTFEKAIARLTKQIHAVAGEVFNINSPSQLAEVLFDKLKISAKGIKKTKTALSTAAEQLEKISEAHPIVPMISEYREISKLQSTYVDALPRLVAKDGRVHTTFNQTVTATGRLSSSEPNLQNIPIRTELGKQIRKAFVAPRGSLLVSADYSQIELRLAAIMAHDRPFLEAFKNGADIHTHTAAEMFGVAEDRVTKDQRRAAKAINFGILYGMGPRALARNTGVSLDEAKRYIDRYFEIHHAIADYIAATKTKIHREGYVETLSGRRRYIPEIKSGMPQLVAAAERMAVNMPIQGTEADILKMAMIEAQKFIDASYSKDVQMLLQVHDELVFEVPHAEAETFSKKIKHLMEGVVRYEIPLVVDVSVGKNWGELKKLA